MSRNRFSHDHQTVHALCWAKTTGGMSEIITTHGLYLSDLTPMELLKQLPEANQVILQTEPPDHIDCVWIFTRSFETFEVEEYLTDVIFADGTSLLIPVRKNFIDETSKRLHTFTYHEGQLNYIFPSIKEFNQQYYSIEYRR
ncbi:competence protein ComK [Sporosarcina luteola]|uniref:competence protein ComK n=1 Tax=Sporosarcina luteola TaxID=582850 RepID=UPI00203AF835|nr:competence protein ComK [Sporosarcina luteola]MCM3636689.1 competence protein ComK [Sporosarcina luteola]